MDHNPQGPQPLPQPQPLPRLPSELWMMILECLPPSFFQQDIGRLALSRRWYSLAFPLFYPRIEYTPRVISRLVHRKSRALDRTYALLCKTLRSVDIVLDGLGSPGPASRGGAGVFGLDGRTNRDGNGDGNGVGVGVGDVDLLGLALGGPDLACFNTPANLVRFCLMLLEFRELKAVRFAARWPNRAWPADPLQGDYLCVRSLEPYVSLLTRLTSLDLDLCGTDVVDDLGAAVHFCPRLRPLLSRLRSLRLRLRTLCPLALLPAAEDGPVTLAELALDLYLGRVSDHNPKLNATRACPEPGVWEWASPLTGMRAAVRGLVGRMAAPARAEMVHLAPSGEVHVWDAATDRCARHGSEEPRQFPACFDRRGPCFPPTGDVWPWEESDVGYTTDEYGGASGVSEPEELAAVDHGL